MDILDDVTLVDALVLESLPFTKVNKFGVMFVVM